SAYSFWALALIVLFAGNGLFLFAQGKQPKELWNKHFPRLSLNYSLKSSSSSKKHGQKSKNKKKEHRKKPGSNTQGKSKKHPTPSIVEQRSSSESSFESEVSIIPTLKMKMVAVRNHATSHEKKMPAVKRSQFVTATHSTDDESTTSFAERNLSSTFDNKRVSSAGNQQRSNKKQPSSKHSSSKDSSGESSSVTTANITSKENKLPNSQTHNSHIEAEKKLPTNPKTTPETSPVCDTGFTKENLSKSKRKKNKRITTQYSQTEKSTSQVNEVIPSTNEEVAVDDEEWNVVLSDGKARTHPKTDQSVSSLYNNSSAYFSRLNTATTTGALANCTGLSKLKIAPTEVTLVSDVNVDVNRCTEGDSAASNCTSLTDVFEKSIAEIKEREQYYRETNINDPANCSLENIVNARIVNLNKNGGENGFAASAAVASVHHLKQKLIEESILQQQQKQQNCPFPTSTVSSANLSPLDPLSYHQKLTREHQIRTSEIQDQFLKLNRSDGFQNWGQAITSTATSASRDIGGAIHGQHQVYPQPQLSSSIQRHHSSGSPLMISDFERLKAERSILMDASSQHLEDNQHSTAPNLATSFEFLPQRRYNHREIEPVHCNFSEYDDEGSIVIRRHDSVPVAGSVDLTKNSGNGNKQQQHSYQQQDTLNTNSVTLNTNNEKRKSHSLDEDYSLIDINEYSSTANNMSETDYNHSSEFYNHEDSSCYLTDMHLADTSMIFNNQSNQQLSGAGTCKYLNNSKCNVSSVMQEFSSYSSNKTENADHVSESGEYVIIDDPKLLDADGPSSESVSEMFASGNSNANFNSLTFHGQPLMQSSHAFPSFLAKPFMSGQQLKSVEGSSTSVDGNSKCDNSANRDAGNDNSYNNNISRDDNDIDITAVDHNAHNSNKHSNIDGDKNKSATSTDNLIKDYKHLTSITVPLLSSDKVINGFPTYKIPKQLVAFSAMNVLKIPQSVQLNKYCKASSYLFIIVTATSNTTYL
ncbi:hypothetical protein GJ496_005201, partial [Pomphorhynchus laevis]